MKRILLILPILILGLAANAYSQSQKIGYIDLQVVIMDSKAGKAAKVSFEKEFQSKRTVIEQKRKALENLRQDFIKNGAVMSESKRKTMADNIEKKQTDLERTREDFRIELQKKDLELTQRILQDIEGIVKQIGDSEGFSMILEKSEGGLLYGGKDSDITQKVIAAYDKK